MLPPSAAAEQEALRPVLQWLRAGDTFVWVGIKQQARAARAHITYSHPYITLLVLYLLGLHLGIKQQAWAVLYLLGLHILLARATLTTRLSAALTLTVG